MIPITETVMVRNGRRMNTDTVKVKSMAILMAEEDTGLNIVMTEDINMVSAAIVVRTMRFVKGTVADMNLDTMEEGTNIVGRV
jgi:hypothetical protein